MKPGTLQFCTRQIREQLCAAALPQSEEQAQWLVSETLKIARFDFVLYPDRVLSEAQQQLLIDNARRLLEGEPLAYIVGRCSFDGWELQLTPDVLIPRPETELLVDRLMKKLESRKSGNGSPLEAPSVARAVDLGTGSGCLAIALAKRLALQTGVNWKMGASDISSQALKVAISNARALNCDIEFREGSWLEPWLDYKNGEKFDLVVSNPPYIAYSEIADVSAQVLHYEPSIALFAEQEGVAVYAHLATHLPDLMKPGALLALEMGWLQSADISKIFEGRGWVRAEIQRDLNERDRFFFVERE